MLDLALDITGLTSDDLFYYKYKARIDSIGLSFQARAQATGSSVQRLILQPAADN